MPLVPDKGPFFFWPFWFYFRLCCSLTWFTGEDSSDATVVPDAVLSNCGPCQRLWSRVRAILSVLATEELEDGAVLWGTRPPAQARRLLLA